MVFRQGVLPLLNEGGDFRPLILTAGLALVYFGSRKILKKGLSPVVLILISACAGIVMYGV